MGQNRWRHSEICNETTALPILYKSLGSHAPSPTVDENNNASLEDLPTSRAGLLS